MRRRHLAILRPGTIALLALAGMSQRAAAQQRQEMVPAVLANAALGMFSGMLGDGPAIVSGRLPDDFPAAVRPASPARVVGYVVFGPFRVAAFSYPKATDLVGRYEAQLVRAGATRASIAQTSGITHGFAPSEPLTASDAHAYCLSSTSVSVALADSIKAPNTLLVYWSPSLRAKGVHSRCDPDYAEFMSAKESMHPGLANPELPALTAPRGVRLTTAGSGGGGDYYESAAWVDTSVKADSLLAHFARQFAQAGWTVGKLVSNAETGTVSLSTTKGKDSWRGALIVVTGPDRRELVVRILRARQF